LVQGEISRQETILVAMAADRYAWLPVPLRRAEDLHFIMLRRIMRP